MDINVCMYIHDYTRVNNPVIKNIQHKSTHFNNIKLIVSYN